MDKFTGICQVSITKRECLGKGDIAGTSIPFVASQFYKHLTVLLLREGLSPPAQSSGFGFEEYRSLPASLLCSKWLLCSLGHLLSFRLLPLWALMVFTHMAFFIYHAGMEHCYMTVRCS